MDALDLTAAGWRAGALRRNNTHDLRSRLLPGAQAWLGIVGIACATTAFVLVRRDGHHGAASASETFSILRLLAFVAVGRKTCG